MTRRDLREQVFRLLFGVEFHEPKELQGQLAAYGETADWQDGDDEIGRAWDAEDGAYITEKYRRIVEHLAEIDAAVNEAAEGWKTSRMGKVDLTLIRLAVFEMRYEEEIPVGVAINEAVELAKKYGTDESPAFVNGVLAKLA